MRMAETLGFKIGLQKPVGDVSAATSSFDMVYGEG